MDKEIEEETDEEHNAGSSLSIKLRLEIFEQWRRLINSLKYFFKRISGFSRRTCKYPATALGLQTSAKKFEYSWSILNGYFSCTNLIKFWISFPFSDLISDDLINWFISLFPDKRFKTSVLSFFIDRNILSENFDPWLKFSLSSGCFPSSTKFVKYLFITLTSQVHEVIASNKGVLLKYWMSLLFRGCSYIT